LTDAKNSLASEEEKVLRLQVEVAQAAESRLRVEKQLESLQSMLEQVGVTGWSGDIGKQAEVI